VLPQFSGSAWGFVRTPKAGVGGSNPLRRTASVQASGMLLVRVGCRVSSRRWPRRPRAARRAGRGRLGSRRSAWHERVPPLQQAEVAPERRVRHGVVHSSAVAYSQSATRDSEPLEDAPGGLDIELPRRDEICITWRLGHR